MTYLFYMVNIMTAADLATQGARASATMILTMLNRIDSVTACWRLKSNVSSHPICMSLVWMWLVAPWCNGNHEGQTGQRWTIVFNNLFWTLNILNCFKNYRRRIYISYNNLGFVQQKTKYITEQPYMLPTLYCQYHSWWNPGDLKEPGHHHAWYWLNKPEYSVSSFRRVSMKIINKSA